MVRISGKLPSSTSVDDLPNSILARIATTTQNLLVLALSITTAAPPSVRWSKRSWMAPIPFRTRRRTCTCLTLALTFASGSCKCIWISVSRLLFSADDFRSRPRTPTRTCTPSCGDYVSKWRTVNSKVFGSTLGTPFSSTTLQVRKAVCWTVWVLLMKRSLRRKGNRSSVHRHWQGSISSKMIQRPEAQSNLRTTLREHSDASVSLFLRLQ